MDPLSGKVYDLEKDDIPDDVRERLIPVPMNEEFDVQKEAETLGEILDEMDRVFELPNPKPEQFYPINREARRRGERRDRALKKRKPSG